MSSLAGQTTLSIIELSGRKRELILSGRSMPFKPATLGGVRLKIVKESYPGNPVASAQVVTTEETDSTLGGRWSDRHLTTSGKVFWNSDGNGLLPLVRAEDVWNAFESLCRAAQLVKLEWGSVFRVGFLSEVSPSWNMREEVEWNGTFTWISRTEDADPPLIGALKKAADSIGAGLDPVKIALAVAVDLLRVLFDTMEDVEDSIRDIENAIKMVETIASLGIEVRAEVLAVAERTMEMCYAASRLCQNVANQARALTIQDNASYMGWMFGTGSRHYLPPGGPPTQGGATAFGLFGGGFGAGVSPADVPSLDGAGSLSFLPGGGGSNLPDSTPRSWHEAENCGMTYERLEIADQDIGAVASDPGAFLLAEIDKRETASTLLESAWRLAEAGEVLRKVLRDDSIVTFDRVREGEDLRHVSIRNFGTADRWHDIAKLNGISGSVPVRGQRLFLPPK